MKIRSPRLFAKSDTGMAAIETALLLPFMLLLFFGMLDLTGHISLSRKVSAVSAATADLVGQGRNTITTAEIQDDFKVAGLIINPKPASDVRVVVSVYRMVGTTATLVWTVNNNLGPACTTTPNTATMSNLMVAGNDLVVAQTCTTYKPYLAEFMGSKILGNTQFSVEQIISVRPRSSLLLNLV